MLYQRRLNLLKNVILAFFRFQTEIQKDFRALRKTAEDAGWLEARPMFYLWHLIHILAFEVLGYMILSRFGNSWLPYVTAAMCFVIAQVSRL